MSRYLMFNSILFSERLGDTALTMSPTFRSVKCLKHFKYQRYLIHHTNDIMYNVFMHDSIKENFCKRKRVNLLKTPFGTFIPLPFCIRYHYTLSKIRQTRDQTHLRILRYPYHRNRCYSNLYHP